MLMTEFIWLPCVSIECILLNCKKIFIYSIGNSEVNVFCKHKRSIVEIYPRKTLQGRVKSSGTELFSYPKCFLPFYNLCPAPFG